MGTLKLTGRHHGPGGVHDQAALRLRQEELRRPEVVLLHLLLAELCRPHPAGPLPRPGSGRPLDPLAEVWTDGD